VSSPLTALSSRLENVKVKVRQGYGQGSKLRGKVSIKCNTHNVSVKVNSMVCRAVLVSHQHVIGAVNMWNIAAFIFALFDSQISWC
jgi:hypothetical protein